MFCPECGTEYPAGVTRCTTCDVELVESPAVADETEWTDLVTVLETGDPSLLLVAKTLLEAEHIAAFAEGQDVQESLGAGRVPEADVPMGPGRLRVRPQDADAARELLRNLQPIEDPTPLED